MYAMAVMTPQVNLNLLAQGVNTLWCSFEVKNTRLLRVMMKQYSLVNIDKDIGEFDRIADKFTRLPLYLTGLDFYISILTAILAEHLIFPMFSIVTGAWPESL